MKKYICMSIFLIFANATFACSRHTNNRSVEDKYNAADDVILVSTNSINNVNKVSEKGFKSVNHSIVFTVLDVWKGGYKVGQLIPVSYDISPGNCMVSATNDPGWLESENGSSSAEKINYVKLSGVWLLYVNKSSGVILEADESTLPLEVGGTREMKTLYKISQL